MNKRFNSTAQGGFTLIELIVVIVILGILAATALPKFASLGGDARLAALNAARGSLNTVVAMTHGKYLMSPSGVTTAVAMEDKTVNIFNGYPKADQGTADAAGLTSSDFAVQTATQDPGPTIATSGQIAIVPASLSGKSQSAKCYILYTEAKSGGVPSVTLVGTAADCE